MTAISFSLFHAVQYAENQCFIENDVTNPGTKTATGISSRNTSRRAKHSGKVAKVGGVLKFSNFTMQIPSTVVLLLLPE